MRPPDEFREVGTVSLSMGAIQATTGYAGCQGCCDVREYVTPPMDKMTAQSQMDQRLREQPSGFTTKEWSDGDKYEGHFEDGKKHGEGTFTWSNGNCYVGNWIADMKHGYGVTHQPCC